MKLFLSDIAKDVRTAVVGVAVLWLLSRIPPLKELAIRFYDWTIKSDRTVWTTSISLGCVAVVLFWVVSRISYYRSEKWAIKSRRIQEQQIQELDKQWKEAMDVIGKLKP